jgi:hypothetical protein
VAEVDTGLVVKCLAPIWESKTETASRVRGRIESVLGWATTSGYRTGENPARWKGHLENLLATISKSSGRRTIHRYRGSASVRSCRPCARVRVYPPERSSSPS